MKCLLATIFSQNHITLFRFVGIKNETPLEYYSYLGLDGRCLDADERPELCRGTVEFAASREFMVSSQQFYLISLHFLSCGYIM